MKNDIGQLLLVTLTASGVGAGFVILIRTGFKSEDVFAFAGAIIGAAGTVAGGAWLSDRSARREKATEQNIIREELVTLVDISASATQRHPRGGEWTDEWRSSIHAMSDICEGAGRFFDEVIAFAKTLDFHQREQIKLLRLHISFFLKFYDDVFNTEGELDPQDERTWLGVVDGVQTATAQAILVFPRQ